MARNQSFLILITIFITAALPDRLAWAGKVNQCLLIYPTVPSALQNDPLVQRTLETDPALIAKQLSKTSGLTDATILAILKNFHDEIVTDGSTGIFEYQGDLYLKPDANLLAAYGYAQAHVHPGALTMEDITGIRSRAMTLLSILKGSKFVEPQVRFKVAGTTATIREEVHPDVMTLMKTYGIHTLYDGRTTKIYYDRDPSEALQKWMTKLNRLSAEHYPPEEIVTVAVQDFLVIHPFQNGNGRTARILGQVLYEKLTGKTIVFSKEFHMELSHSPSELTRSLFEKSETLVDRRTVDPINKYTSAILKLNGTVPAFMPDQQPAHSPGDAAFWPEVKIQTKRFKYSEIDPSLRRYGEPVFYGRPAKSLDDAKKNMRLLFEFGRTSRGHVHLDLEKHAMSTQGEASGFFPTSISSTAAETFATKKQGIGIVYFIDPTEAEILNLNEFINTLGFGGGYFDEKEILFPSKLSPDRIIGGVIGHSVKGKFVPDETVLNPNHRRRNEIEE